MKIRFRNRFQPGITSLLASDTKLVERWIHATFLQAVARMYQLNVGSRVQLAASTQEPTQGMSGTAHRMVMWPTLLRMAVMPLLTLTEDGGYREALIGKQRYSFEQEVNHWHSFAISGVSREATMWLIRPRVRAQNIPTPDWYGNLAKKVPAGVSWSTANNQGSRQLQLSPLLRSAPRLRQSQPPSTTLKMSWATLSSATRTRTLPGLRRETPMLARFLAPTATSTAMGSRRRLTMSPMPMVTASLVPPKVPASQFPSTEPNEACCRKANNKPFWYKVT